MCVYIYTYVCIYTYMYIQGQTLALPGPEPVRKIRPKSVGTAGKGAQARSVGSSSLNSGHGNVIRTPFGQRDEDKERVCVSTILSNLESILHNLDGLNNKLIGTSTIPPCPSLFSLSRQPLFVSLFPFPSPLLTVLFVWPHRPNSRRDDGRRRQRR